MPTIATLFSGGEGVSVGAQAAGLRHLWGIEHDPDIAAVAQVNGFDVAVGDVCKMDPGALPVPDVLHASPPCRSFSDANTSRGETALDIALGEATARFIRALRPRIFTLENVYRYRKSESWAKIAQALGECGYMFDLARLNAADFGVAQSRHRMWVRAVRGGLVPHLPAPEPWVGWYAAIEDLLPDLPDDEFAPWQLKRMPDELRETVLLAQGAYDDKVVMRRAGEPANTVTANSNQSSIRAFVVGATSDGFAIRGAGEPANTVLASNPRRPTRAFLMGATNAHGTTPCTADEPARTVTATHPALGMRAFVVDGGNAGRPPTVRYAEEPIFTIDAQRDSKHPRRAAIRGRVVRLSPRCLARFQSFPDWYELPDNKTLAARIIGNAVPPLLYEKLIRNLGIL